MSKGCILYQCFLTSWPKDWHRTRLLSTYLGSFSHKPGEHKQRIAAWNYKLESFFQKCCWVWKPFLYLYSKSPIQRKVRGEQYSCCITYSTSTITPRMSNNMIVRPMVVYKKNALINIYQILHCFCCQSSIVAVFW